MENIIIFVLLLISMVLPILSTTMWIVYAVKYKNTKKELNRVYSEIRNSRTVNTAQKNESISPAPIVDAANVPNVPVSVPPVASTPNINQGIYSSMQAEANQPMASRQLASTEPIARQANSTPNWKPSPAPRKHSVSTISIILILGAFFLNIAGLIFATNTWDSLPAIAKIPTIFIFSIIFFLMSSIAYYKLDLDKTGMVFHTIGSFFLPITLICGGFLSVFGNWLSTTGEGNFLFFGIAALLLMISTLIGGKIYMSKFLVHTSLISLSIALFFIIYQFTHNFSITSIIIGIYSFIVIILANIIKKNEDTYSELILLELPTFSFYNTILLSIFPIISLFESLSDSDFRFFTMTATAIFAACYLTNAIMSKNYIGNSITFMSFITFSLCSLISPKSSEASAALILCIITIPMVLSILGVLPDGLKKVFAIMSNICGLFGLIIFFMFTLFAPASLELFIVFAIFTIEFMLLIYFKRKEKIAIKLKYLLPILLITVSIMGCRLACEESFTTLLLSLSTMILIYQIIYITATKLNLRSVFTDISFLVAILIMGICNSTDIIVNHFISMDYTMIYTFTTLVLICASLINFIKSSNVVRIISLTIFTLLLLMISGAMYVIAQEPALFILLSGLIITSTSIIIIYAKQFKLVGIIYSIIARLSLIPLMALLYYNIEILTPFVLLFIIISLVAGHRHTSKADIIIGLMAFTLGLPLIAEDILGDISFREIILFMILAAFIISGISFLLKAKKCQSYIEYGLTSKYSLLVLTTLGFISIYTDLLYLGIITIGLIYTGISFYRSRNTYPLILPITLNVISLATNFGDNMTYIICSILMLVLIALSYILHREKIVDKYYFDIFIVPKILLALIIFDAILIDEFYWFGYLVVALGIFSILRLNHSSTFKKIIYSILILLGLIAIVDQGLFTVPRLIETEYFVLLFISYPVCLSLLWKGNVRKVIQIITTVATAIEYIVLFSSISGLFDALFIAITALLMLVISFIFKTKKWFILSLVISIVSIILMSSIYWNTIGWWIFMVSGGILLIVLGTTNELKNQRAAKMGIKKKRFMSEWKW